jgi:hypothetical protein
MSYYKNFIILILLATCIPSVHAEKSATFPPSTITAAKDMLNQHIGNWRFLSNLDQSELSKRLNALVFNVCKSPTADYVATSMDSLFNQCITACGGRSYVLRGLLAVYGISSEYYSIYNIPIQGNHVAVSAHVGGKQIFLDPTFGTFFTQNNIDDVPLNLDEIKFSFDLNTLPNHVYQAKKINNLLTVSLLPIENIYTSNFHSDYLQLNSYLEHESSDNTKTCNILYLSAEISLKQGTYELGCTHARTPLEASSCFLNQTNQLYSSSHAKDYISYNFSSIGYLDNQMRVNFFNLSNL